MSDHSDSADEVVFGPFRFFPTRGILLDGDKRLRLGSRALEILKTLIESAGNLVSKEDLVARVWPNTHVEEGNLRVHMAALRRALGDGQAGQQYIVTTPGRGYRFVAAISAPASSPTAAPPAAVAESSHNLPSLLTRMIGRDDVVAALVSQLPERRFITIVGPGGIGKTTVALAVANELHETYPGGVRFIDLAPVADPVHVPSAVASALGIAINTSNAPAEMVNALKDQQMLLVLDSCEHVIDAAAALAEDVLRGSPGVHILATSREAMRAEGERVHRLGPLGVPAAGISATQALTYPAVQLFVERASVNLTGLELADAEVPAIADICRRLDGIALAIELAASRVDTFGVKGLATRIDDRFRLLTRGRRTALPRHQTLSATLDWSYEFLPQAEQVVLRRLGIFAGAFTLGSARSVVATGDIDPMDIDDHIANLVAKSLVSANLGEPIVTYRLMETTRAYCLNRLKHAGECESLARRHAEYFRDLFERAQPEWETRPGTELLATYGFRLDNVRTALDWAFSAVGDPAVGVALTIAVVPFWKFLSLMEECRTSTRRALDSLQRLPRADTSETMKLLVELGAATRYDSHPSSAIGEVWTRALSIAERLGDTDYQLRAISGLRNLYLSEGRLRETLVLARKFKDVATSAPDPMDVLVGERMVGYALHFLGEIGEARHHVENVLHELVPNHRSHIIRFVYDQRVLAYDILAEGLWLQGFPDRAMVTARQNVEYASSLNHELSLCNALGQCACPIALFVGDLIEAERYVAMLLEHSTKQGLRLWHATARCFEGVLRIKQDDLAVGLRTLRSGISELLETRFVTRYVAFLAELAEGCIRAGEFASAKAAIDQAFDRCQRDEEFWYIAELFRVKGDFFLHQGEGTAAEAAEENLLQSLDWARRKGMLSWELRAATSLARLRYSQGRREEAREQLSGVYGRFTEGLGTADLRAAKQLLDALA